MSHSPVLLILVLLPLVGSLVVFALPENRSLLAKQLTLAVSLVVTVYSVIVLFSLDTALPTRPTDRFQYAFDVDWIKAFGVHIAFGADGIAAVLVAMAAVLVSCVVIGSWNSLDSRSGAEEAEVRPRRSVKNYFALLLLLEFFMVGVFTATDVFLFYVFFEAMLVPMYFIIGSFGGPRRQYAAMKFFLYSLVGGLLMLASVIGLYVSSGTRSFLMTDLIAHPLPDNATQKWLFLGFFIAFAIKAPLVPFHTWLPDAGAEAPTGGAALLVGVLDKVGTFGFLRYCLVLFPGASKFFAPVVLVLSVIGVLYAAFLAIGQRDMKRLVAYTSVAHFGFIGLGIFAFTTQGGTGAVFYMVNHGFSTGALFLVVGMVIARGKSRNVDDYGGLAKVAPRLGGLFLLAGLSALALPGMSTFISEFLVLVGTFTRYKGYAIIATTGIILAAIYVLYLYKRVFQGPPGRLLSPDEAAGEAAGDVPAGAGTDSPAATSAGRGASTGGATAVATAPRRAGVRAVAFRDANAREIAAVAPLIAIIVFLGVYPKPVLDVINPAVKVTLQQDIGTSDPTPQYGGQK